ncbi:monocarboxylate transporter [Trichoderma camerunense]
MATMSLELSRTIGEHGGATEDEAEQDRSIQTLPPTDQGPKAWRFLFGCFMIEAVLWGIPVNYGVFQNYYSRQPEFQDNTNIALIGTLATSIQFLGAPFATPLVKKYHAWQRHMVWTGCALCVISLLAASFCTSIAGLAVTQGALYGTGFLIMYFPILCMMNEWFVRRRGLAYGILYAGGGLSGVGLPFLMEWLLARFGYKITLRALAVGVFLLIAPIQPLLKGRLPPSHSGAIRAVDLSFLAQSHFWVLALSNLCQGFAYYMPGLYLPTYASALGYSSRTGALILAASNLASTLGQVSFGYLTDRVDNVHILVFVSTTISAVVSFTLWGMAHSLTLLIVFAIAYGWFAGAYPVYWPRFGSLISEDPQPVYSMMSFGKGVGNVVAGPISATLLTRPLTSGYGMGRFQPLIVFVGSLMGVASLVIVGWPLRRFTPVRRRFTS